MKTIKHIMVVVFGIFAIILLTGCSDSLASKYPNLKPGQEVVVEEGEVNGISTKHVVRMNEDGSISEIEVAASPK